MTGVMEKKLTIIGTPSTVTEFETKTQQTLYFYHSIYQIWLRLTFSSFKTKIAIPYFRFQPLKITKLILYSYKLKYISQGRNKKYTVTSVFQQRLITDFETSRMRYSPLKIFIKHKLLEYSYLPELYVRFHLSTY